MNTRLFFPLVLFAVACNTAEAPSDADTVYFCDAEEVSGEGDVATFASEEGEFLQGDTRSDEAAYEGKYSSKLDSAHLYGMSLKLTDVEVGEYFEATVMTKDEGDNGTLIVQFSGDHQFSINSKSHQHDTDKEGWRKHFINFTVDSPAEEIKFFAFSNGNTCYFDNMTIKRYAVQPRPENQTAELLSITIDDSSNLVLKNYKYLALRDGIIRDEYKQYVDAMVHAEGNTYPAEIRLKGDWTDHLETGKISYRVKTSSEGAFMGLRSFSIQHPQTRNYMHEWFVHRWCDKEDLLSTLYDFVAVEINGDYRGIFAVEEHFDRQLLERHNRREGPILKLDETGFWELLVNRTEETAEKEYPYYEASHISLFKKGRTTKSQILFDQFQNGAKLLQRFKDLDEHPEELLDLEQTAKYYAILDVANVQHAKAWHNRRFYYNPIEANLEHIGFDMQPGIYPMTPISIVMSYNMMDHNYYRDNLLDHYLFQNQEFVNLYMHYIELFSSEAYLDAMFEELSEEIAEKEEILASEFDQYQFERSFYYEKAERCRSEIKNIYTLFENNGIPQGRLPLKEREYTPNTTPFGLEEIGLTAYVDAEDSMHNHVLIENYHLNGLEVVGYAIKGAKDSMIQFNNSYILDPFTEVENVSSAEFILSEYPNYFYFKLENSPNLVFRKKALPWPKPVRQHPRIELANSFSVSSPYYKVSGDSLLTFNSGEYSIDKLLYIPANYEVVFQEGTEIDLINRGGIIINASCTMNGGEKGIKFTSSDTTSIGVTILEAEKTVVRNVEITNFGCLNYKGWVLTGAFTIYNSEVEIDGLRIDGNTCEDALNTIRCNFNIQNLSISNTHSDGFDSDFCDGVFKKSSFESTGNDCIDFSGSNVEISDIDIKNCGDKGISGGERSHLVVRNINIDGALTGIASKDQSVVEATNIKIANVEFGVATFRKKPEFGPAQIEISDVTAENVVRDGIIELGSQVTWDGKVYRGYTRFDIEAMYARFEK